jgi:hypothetical protein
MKTTPSHVRSVLRSKGFKSEPVGADDHQTWKQNGDQVLVDKGGDEWHTMKDGNVKQVGKLGDVTGLKKAIEAVASGTSPYTALKNL